MKVKFVFAGTIQRVNLAEHPTFTDLVNAARRKYQDQNLSGHQFFYLDEAQEEILIKDDEDLRCMLEDCQEKGIEPKVIVKPETPAAPAVSHVSPPVSPPAPHQAPMPMPEQTSNKIFRLALHSTPGAVGNFYNAKSEQFIKDQNFQKDAFEIDEPKESVFLIGLLDDLNERFDRLHVNEEQKLSIISSLAEVSQHGIGNFLLKCFSSSNDIFPAENSFAVVKIWQRKMSKLELTNEKFLKRIISQKPLENVTHVVKTVHSGYAVCAVFSVEVPTQGEPFSVEQFKKAIHETVRNPRKQSQNKILLLGEPLTKVQFFADPQLNIPTTANLSEALKIFANSPEGVPMQPLQYELAPLNLLMKKRYLNDSNNAPIPMTDHEFATHFTDMAQAAWNIRNFREEMEKILSDFPHCFSNEQHATLFQECNLAKIKTEAYYSEMRTCLLHYRKRAQCKLKTCNECLAQKEALEERMHQLEPLFAKIRMAKFLKENGIYYIGTGTIQYQQAIKNAGLGNCFVFFCTGPDDLAESNANWKLFMQLVERGEKCIFVDQEVLNVARAQTTGTIMKYKNFEFVCDDYGNEETRQLGSNIAKINKQFFETPSEAWVQPADSQLANFQCKCPRGCTDDEQLWECNDCGEFIAVLSQGSELCMNFFCCDCGRVPVQFWSFKCKAVEHHGKEFVPFTQEQLEAEFKNFNFGERNILILGESGVGKSTWINALANYMTFRSLDDALKENNPVYLIPAQFKIADEHMKSQLVQIGSFENDEDERKAISKSATKHPKAHVFPYKGGKVRLIDTPGIGDTEGLEEDKRNFAATLAFIANLKELHGICILLKPNNARLSENFKYCMNELLLHLHVNAAKNILFCFTNARGTLYRPGDTLETLHQHLEDLQKAHKEKEVNIKLDNDTIFCMDNEAFRFIWALHRGIKFDQSDIENFAQSWKKSYVETNRLLERVNSLNPHRTTETVSLNEARKIITTLTQPIAVIANTIQENIALMEEEQKRLATLNVWEQNLSQKLMTPMYYIDVQIMPNPRTICASEKCTERRIGKYGEATIHYKTVCHENCFINGSLENVFPNQNLRWCAIFKQSGGQTCNVCGCHWAVHMNTRNQQIQRLRLVENPQVRNLLHVQNNAKAAINLAIAEKQEWITKFKGEQQKINEIAARFGAFLKMHAITPYNDSLEEYMKIAIRVAEQAAQQTGNNSNLEGLKEYLRLYKEQRKIIDESLTNGTDNITPEDIKRYLTELIGMEMMGENIKKLFEAEKEAQAKQMSYMERCYSPVIRNPAKAKSSKAFTSPLSPCTTESSISSSQMAMPTTSMHVDQQQQEIPTIQTQVASNEQKPPRMSETPIQQEPIVSNKATSSSVTSTSSSTQADNQNNKESQNVVPPIASAKKESESRKRLASVALSGTPSDPRLQKAPRINQAASPAVPEETAATDAVVAKVQENVQKIDDKLKRLNIEEVGFGVENAAECEVTDMEIASEEDELDHDIKVVDVKKGDNSGKELPKQLKVEIKGENGQEESRQIQAAQNPIETIANLLNKRGNTDSGNPAAQPETPPIKIPKIAPRKNYQDCNSVAPNNAFGTYREFLKSDPGLVRDRGFIKYPWRSLHSERIIFAYDIVPDNKTKFDCLNAANSAARALILCGIDQCLGKPWDQQFNKFSEDCPKEAHFVQNRAMPRSSHPDMISTTVPSTVWKNPSHWALCDYMNRFMAKPNLSRARIFTYAEFAQCAQAIVEDVRNVKPVLLCYKIAATAEDTQFQNWHFVNVIALKYDNVLRAQEFVLLEIDRTIEQRTRQNLEQLLRNSEIGNGVEEEAGQQQANKYTIIRFQGK